MTVKTYVAGRSLNTRYDANDQGHKQGRGNTRLVVGRVKVEGTTRIHRAYIDLDFPSGFWDDVEMVTAAQLQLTIASDGSSDVFAGDSAFIKVRRNTEHFKTAPKSGWDNDNWEPHRTNADQSWYAHCGTGEHQTAINVDILNLVRLWAPGRVVFKQSDGRKLAGLHKTSHGLSLMGKNEGGSVDAAEFYSTEVSTTAFRPTITLTYEKVNEKPVATLVDPTGNVTSAYEYSGTFAGPEVEDTITKAAIEVRKVGKTEVLHDPIVAGITLSEDDDRWHIPGPAVGLLAKGSYEARARVWDDHDLASDWTTWKPFVITSIAPIVTPIALGAQPDMDNLLFNAPWTVDPLAGGIARVDIQLQKRGGSWVELLWSESYAPTSPERDRNGVLTDYRGTSLAAGLYDWRVRVTDGLGGTSAWANDATLSIVAGPPPGDTDPIFVTGWNSLSVNQRILIRAMRESDRGPGKIVGIIENASNIGSSWYASAPGELYFTLPTTHPQVSVIEPLNAHYEFQQYRQGAWKTLAYGLIRDFDAAEEETVFYGMDYLGLLSWSIEAATQPEKDEKRNIGQGIKDINGSRYFQKTIGYIIKDQLRRARGQDEHSPVKFIETGRIDKFDSKVTIFASYAERLGFIRGLIDSHKGAVRDDGGERRSRVRVVWNPNANDGKGQFQFDALDNVGKDKDDIRLEYGGLIQGYQVIALDEFATRIYAIGKEPNASRPYFTAVDAKGIDPKQWGHIGTPAFYEDIVDKADLIRRARALGIQRSRVGKRMALGLRVSGLDPFDGWDILDAIPIVIDDGIVDTSLYGSGYWVIWGVEWRVFPDAHDELTLIVRPRGDRADIEPDLIPSDPIHYKTDWKWGPGPPPSVTP